MPKTIDNNVLEPQKKDLEKLCSGKMFSVDLRLLPHGVAGDAIQLIKFSSHIIVMDVK